VRALYQGEATIERPDGSKATATVMIWGDDSDVDSSWGGRAIVRLPDSLVNDLGSNCTIRWPMSGGGYMVGDFVLSVGQIGEGLETYRLVGRGEPTIAPAEA
jgi:hypothetical protein